MNANATSNSPADRVGLRRTQFEHSVQHVARQAYLHCLGSRVTTSESASEEPLVAEESILDPGLPMIA